MNGAWAWLPPHPNSTRPWESVHDMRKRLNLDFNYTPSHLHPEMCRYLTEEECELSDIAMRAQQAKNRNLQQANPTTGKIKVLVLMVLFTDHTERDLISKDEVEKFWQTKVPGELIFSGSKAVQYVCDSGSKNILFPFRPDWINANSQGVYEIEATVIDWGLTDNTEIYYSFGKTGIVPEGRQMAFPILDRLDAAGFDFAPFDGDNDGYLDSVVLIHSGYGAETEKPDCFDREHTDRIWAHAFTGVNSNSWISSDRNYIMAGYTVASAFTGICGIVPNKIGLTVHEYMHTLGTSKRF